MRIWLGFYLGGEMVYDYEHQLRIVSSKEAGIQAIDKVFGGLHAIDAAWNPPEANSLGADVRRIVARERRGPNGCLTILGKLVSREDSWDKAFRKLSDRFGTVAQQLREVDDRSAILEEVQQRVDILASLFELPTSETDRLMAQARDQAIYIQALASQAARRG